MFAFISNLLNIVHDIIELPGSFENRKFGLHFDYSVQVAEIV